MDSKSRDSRNGADEGPQAPIGLGRWNDVCRIEMFSGGMEERVTDEAGCVQVLVAPWMSLPDDFGGRCIHEVLP